VRFSLIWLVEMLREDIINLRGVDFCHLLFGTLEMNHSNHFRSWEDYHTVSIHNTYYWTFIFNFFVLDYFSFDSKKSLTNICNIAAQSANETSKIRRFALFWNHINTLKFRSTQNILVILDSLVVKLYFVQTFYKDLVIIWTADDWSGVA
jgi:hypothetical protein